MQGDHQDRMQDQAQGMQGGGGEIMQGGKGANAQGGMHGVVHNSARGMQEARQGEMQGSDKEPGVMQCETQKQMQDEVEGGRESQHLGMGDTCAPTRTKWGGETKEAAKQLANASAKDMPQMREHDDGDGDGGEATTAAGSNDPPKAV